jgi:hypothetical protein
MITIRFIALTAALIIVPGCLTRQKPTIARHINMNKAPILNKSIDIPDIPACPPITVWIHGTRLLPKGMFERFFFSKPGLNHYATLESKYHQHRIAQTLIAHDPRRFCAETFYLFGWSGKLSFAEREKAATDLYSGLKKARSDYSTKYGQEPEIRLIAHSHGGNIALLLEKIKDPADINFAIQELILLAVPAQTQTMHYTQAPLFKKVYSLYSMLDILQVIDPQGLSQGMKQPLFSERHFPCDSKIEQVAIKFNNRSIMHIEFVQRSFLAKIPTILNTIDQWKKESSYTNQWANLPKCLNVQTKHC